MLNPSISKRDIYVVGIGASAGGLEALKQFFAHLPNQVKAAFVIVQHLSSDYTGFARDFLSQHTELEVVTTVHNQALKPGCIYLAPDNMGVRVSNGRLQLEELTGESVLRMPVDFFLHSLGLACKDKAIGVILSGTGTDGALGVKTIHEQGGIVLIQQPETADYEEMPAISIAVDSPDWVLPPEQMGEKLQEYTLNPKLTLENKVKLDPYKEREIIGDIVQLVSDFSHVNFKRYKLNTLLRRIERRVHINKLDTAEEYRHFLSRHPEELHILYHEMLIGVTSFFRDSKAFAALSEKVLPQLCQQQRYEPLRVWVAGCSTGEEAYTVAILLDEYLQQHNLNSDYKIFATDLDNRAIEFASYGRYRDTIFNEVDPERLRKYFVRSGNFYEVKKEIRRRIIFAKHNLINDPPFIKMDLITCRNLFIYLKPELQQKLALNFSYALKPQGFLMLGAHESLSDAESGFEVIDHKWKIFRNRGGNHYRYQLLDSGFHLPDVNYNADRRPGRIPAPVVAPQPERLTEILVQEYAPACLLINTSYEVLYIHGNVDKYLQFPRKRASFHLFNLIPESLSPIFRNGIRKVSQGNANVAFKNILFVKDERSFSVNLNFKATRENGAGDAFQTSLLILIEFRDVAMPDEKELVVPNLLSDGSEEKAIQNLEHELAQVKRELQHTVDELETINEELQASNEEMLSVNEEMQSANEELQSSNEELFTVNTELKNKVDELTLLHNDLKNLLTSTEIATIFLDKHLNIRRFTPSSKAHFNFVDSDIGRPLSDITHHFRYYDFMEDAKQVMQALIPMEKEIAKKTGEYFILRMLPYRTEDLQIIGVVITLMNVTELKETNNRLLATTQDLQLRTEELKRSEQHWRSLVDNTPDLLFRFDASLYCTYVNRAAERELGVPSVELMGKQMPESGVLPNEQSQDWHAHLQQVLQTRTDLNYYQEITVRGEKRYFFTKIIPEFSPENSLDSILTISREITALKQTEMDLKRSEESWRSLVDNTPDIVARFDRQLRYTFANRALELELGVKADSLIGRTQTELGHLKEAAQMQEMQQKVLNTGEARDYYFHHQSRTGEIKYFYSKLVPEIANDGAVTGVLLITRDVTQLKNFEMELLRSEYKWRSLVNNTPDLVVRFDDQLRMTFVNAAVEKELGLNAAKITGKTGQQVGFPTRRDARSLMTDLRRVIRKGQPINHFTSLEKDGQPYHLFIRMVPEFGVDGETVESVLAIARDVTQLKNYELALNAKNTELQHINEYLENFVYAAAHDLQSPVVSLKVLTQMASDPNRHQQTGEFIGLIAGSVDRLSRTLNGLLDLVRVQSPEENIRPVSFSEVLEQVQAELSEGMQEARAQVLPDFEAYPQVRYVRGFLTSIFRNLLSNAVKYRSPRQPLEVRVKTEKQDGSVLLKIEDNGQGIDLQKYGQEMFKPFKRISTQAGGIGLGLHLVKYMVEKNGGRIEVQSEPDRGATFLVYLREYN